MEYKRILWADSLKGWLIILVVLGHAIQGVLGSICESNHLWNIIYSFHMPAFMAISGYLNFRNINDINISQTVWQIVYRRFKQLFVPFFMWTIILLIIGNKTSPQKIIDYLIYPDKGLWFLWVLFFICTIFYIGLNIAKKIKIKHEWIVLFMCFALVSLMVLFDVRILGIQFIAYYYLFYSIGYFLHKYEEHIRVSSILLLSILTLCWVGMAWFWKMHELPEFIKGLPIPVTITQYSYRFITALIAVYLLLFLSPRVLDCKKLYNIPFVRIGKVSLGIYTTHVLVITWIISFFRDKTNNVSMLIFYSFIAALLASWLIVWMLSKWKITARYFLGKI